AKAKKLFDGGPCSEGTIGLLHAIGKNSGLFFRIGWRQPVFIAHSDYRTKQGGPVALIGLKIQIPGHR
ncbi:MAG TPA: hypothetical protein VF857_04935, partial [Spirochaetota bacterium]